MNWRWPARVRISAFSSAVVRRVMASGERVGGGGCRCCQFNAADALAWG